tara:strand:- start:1994 stop:2302 length:309 start_codon:yes stop_codon:yes gene_type:complete
LIDIFKNKPPQNKFSELKSYQNVEFKQKYSIELIERFFKKFPEERRGRKKFKEKEIQNMKLLIYEKILQKGIKVKADCIGSIKEKVDKEYIIITVSYFKKNE